MKVIVADKISELGVKLLQAQDGWHTVLTTKETLEAEIADADALIVRSATKVTEDLLAKAPKLRAVGRAGVGVDNIDLEAATKCGVLVMSTPGGSSVSVAEHTFALLLSLARQVPRLDRAIHEGRWEKSAAKWPSARRRLICACWPTTHSSAKRRRTKCRSNSCRLSNCSGRAILFLCTRRSVRRRGISSARQISTK